MKMYSIIPTSFIVLLSLGALGQGVSKDSLNALNQQKQNIEISKKLNERKIDLAKLQNDFAEKTQEVDKATAEAQTAANENQQLATRLKDNPQNKKLADQANKAAKQAEKSSKSARKANDDLNDLKSDIESLQKKISEDESKLGSAPTFASSTATAGSTPTMVSTGQTQQETPKMVSGQVIRRNINMDSVSVTESPQTLSDKIIESTYKNYPQQAGQPTIIINNIIVPSDYNQSKPAASPKADMQQNRMSEMSDYEDFKAWQRQRQAQQGNNMSTRRNSNFSQSDSDEDMVSSRNSSDDRLTFKERFGEKPARNSGLWVIPMVGIHASNFNADLKDGEADGRIGWNAGLDFRMHAKRFFFQPGAHYFSSSLQVTSEDSVSNAPLLTGPRIHSLKVPVLLGLYLTKANKGFFKMNVKAGATGTYVISVDKNDQAQFQKDNIEDFSYGLNAGIGLEFGFITLDITHEWGITALFKENNVKNNVLRATVGFKL